VEPALGPLRRSRIVSNRSAHAGAGQCRAACQGQAASAIDCVADLKRWACFDISSQVAYQSQPNIFDADFVSYQCKNVKVRTQNFRLQAKNSRAVLWHQVNKLPPLMEMV